jgi:CRISPR-associated protein Cas2
MSLYFHSLYENFSEKTYHDTPQIERGASFSKFLKKHGRRLQYSVFELKNSHRILQNVIKEVEYKYKPLFKKSDSVLIYQICQSCEKKILRYGYAVHEEESLVCFS